MQWTDVLSMLYTTKLKGCSPAACYDSEVDIHHTKSCSQTHAQTQTNNLFQDLKFKRVSTQLDEISLLHT